MKCHHHSNSREYKNANPTPQRNPQQPTKTGPKETTKTAYTRNNQKRQAKHTTQSSELPQQKVAQQHLSHCKTSQSLKPTNIKRISFMHNLIPNQRKEEQSNIY